MLRFRSLWLLPLALSFAASTAEAQTVLFSDDFENGTSNWTMEALWHLTDEGATCHDASFPSGTHCMWYGMENTCQYTSSPITRQSLRLTAALDVPADGLKTLLEFWSRSETEGGGGDYDRQTVEVSTDGGGQWTIVHWVLAQTEPWTFHQVDLSSYAGQTIDLRFSFWAVDSLGNWFLGWLVDDVAVRTIPQAFPTTCFGDASGAACPCSNSGAAGRGCQNSVGTGGAHLSIVGTTSPDTIVIQASGELPIALTIFLQGNANVGPIGFGDGLRCAGGSLKRLYVTNATGGIASAPALGDPTVSQRATALGDVLDPGSRRYYQTYYRDPNTAFCAPPQGANFNASQMRRITW